MLLSYFAQRPPLVAIRCEDRDLLLGVLIAKPFRLDAALYLSRQEKAVKFKTTKGTWCLQIDLLEVPNGVELNSYIYTINTSNDYKNIIVPVHDILIPDTIDVGFYAYFDFISCTPSTSYRKYDGTEFHSLCYKINRRSMATLLRVS